MAIIYANPKSRRKPQNTRKRRELQKDWEALLKRWPVVSKAKKKLLKDSLAVVLSRNSNRLVSSYPSVAVDPVKPVMRKRYVGEMAEREAKAQEEIKQKQKRVAILFNKGGYGYITDGMDPKTFGRK